MARPDKAHAEPGNSALERQLDAKGKKTAAAMGAALQKLSIPVGEVYSSPTFRAIETVDLAGLPDAITESALDAGTTNMSAAADAARADWLKMQVASLPRMGTDTFIVTHTPNIRAAFGDEATGIGAGEALVFHPDGQGNMPLVARIKITDWPKLAGG